MSNEYHPTRVSRHHGHQAPSERDTGCFVGLNCDAEALSPPVCIVAPASKGIRIGSLSPVTDLLNPLLSSRGARGDGHAPDCPITCLLKRGGVPCVVRSTDRLSTASLGSLVGVKLRSGDKPSTLLLLLVALVVENSFPSDPSLAGRTQHAWRKLRADSLFICGRPSTGSSPPPGVMMDVSGTSVVQLVTRFWWSAFAWPWNVSRRCSSPHAIASVASTCGPCRREPSRSAGLQLAAGLT
eukprot:363869-Chlamydomonas_euryale.AAC.15